MLLRQLGLPFREIVIPPDTPQFKDELEKHGPSGRVPVLIHDRLTVWDSLSNGNADLGRIGIAGLFELSLSARAVGVPKPHPRAFEALASGLGVPAARILFVGDDPDLDVHAPRAVGMQAAWINRRDVPWPQRLAPPDIVVRDCAELAVALVSLDGQ